MESVLKKIFSGKNDKEVHDEFIKFGRGEFKDRYLIQTKNQKNGWNIKTSHEFANFLVRRCLKNISGEIEIKGIIVSTFDLRDDCKFEIGKVKQFMGVKQLVVDCKTDVKNILELVEKYPRAFYALSFKSGEYELKIKPKTPKGAKPSNKSEAEPKADFCSLKTNDEEIIEELFFDFPIFNEISIKHTIIIDKVIFPSGVEDPTKLRELARKKGKIIRQVRVDGKEERREKEFEV